MILFSSNRTELTAKDERRWLDELKRLRAERLPAREVIEQSARITDYQIEHRPCWIEQSARSLRF